MQFAGGQPFLTRSYARGAVEDLLSHLATALPVNREGSFDATILGDTLRIRAVREQVRNVARFRDVSVLILGETGTGKELVAESIHRLTFGASRPFMAINCAAVPESLFESEIFGHEAGAYTGARGVRVGLLESAAGGTVFLDEIGEMPLSLQPKLLRVLESRTFRRVGSNKDIPLGARVISATNRLVFRREEGALRPDLYYRLAGFTITLPPLRERVDDVATLAHAFVRAFAERHHLHNLVLTDEAVAVLCAHRWPGNVRELRAVVEQAAILAGGGPIGEGPLATILRDPAAGARHPSTAPPPPRKDPPAPAESAVLKAARDVSESPESLRDVERRLILQAHESSAGNLTRAAKVLGMPRTTLRAKLRRWGILVLCSQGTRARVAMDTRRATRVRSGRRASSSAGPAPRLARGLARAPPLARAPHEARGAS